MNNQKIKQGADYYYALGHDDLEEVAKLLIRDGLLPPSIKDKTLDELRVEAMRRHISQLGIFNAIYDGRTWRGVKDKDLTPQQCRYLDDKAEANARGRRTQISRRNDLVRKADHHYKNI